VGRPPIGHRPPALARLIRCRRRRPPTGSSWVTDHCRPSSTSTYPVGSNPISWPGQPSSVADVCVVLLVSGGLRKAGQALSGLMRRNLDIGKVTQKPSVLWAAARSEKPSPCFRARSRAARTRAVILARSTSPYPSKPRTGSVCPANPPTQRAGARTTRSRHARSRVSVGAAGIRANRRSRQLAPGL
jgi:hypothetical protein